MRNFPSSTQRLSFNLSRPVSRDPDSVSVWDADYDFLFRPEDQSYSHISHLAVLWLMIRAHSIMSWPWQWPDSVRDPESARWGSRWVRTSPWTSWRSRGWRGCTGGRVLVGGLRGGWALVSGVTCIWGAGQSRACVQLNPGRRDMRGGATRHRNTGLTWTSREDG